jgi:hypothetical protein
MNDELVMIRKESGRQKSETLTRILTRCTEETHEISDSAGNHTKHIQTTCQMLYLYDTQLNNITLIFNDATTSNLIADWSPCCEALV